MLGTHRRGPKVTSLLRSVLLTFKQRESAAAFMRLNVKLFLAGWYYYPG